MAQCKLTPREFIVNTFSPQVAAVCSANADATCQKNNLSFIELLQPFCRINTEGHLRDPQGNVVVLHSLQISVRDVNSAPPEPSLARKLLNESVSSTFNERSITVKTGSVDLEIPVSVPWFEAWRDTFLSVQFPSDHEFTKHFLACMVVVSTADDNPLDKIQQIIGQLNQTVPGKLPKWFNNNALRYYVLTFDTFEDDEKKAEEAFLDMENIYGPNNCFLLQMNSRPPENSDNSHLPDPWSQFIVKHSDLIGSGEQNSSPRTPADTSVVSSMPNAVTMESEKSTSQAGTPIAPRTLPLLSPDTAENVSIASDDGDGQVGPLEVGQEAVLTTLHPLSPENEVLPNINHVKSGKLQFSNTSPINANVWADSPTHVIPHHGARLSTEDLDRVRTMLSEFCLKSLFPYVEKQMNMLNDIISNKKGVSRSLFSATKRWFGTNKPGVPGSVPANAVIYTVESPELQLRRLGDLSFMFGHYSLAYQAYHNAKRDFAADQAWLYYAGALEMAALSAFMLDEMIRKTIEYMDDAITTYANTCKMPQFATRATLLSAECLKHRGLYGEAAKQLIRMTSEESDLRSALLLEQAAYCFIVPKMIRKYAFHAVLAGHRFSKAGQKKHSLRCYRQAYQVYYEKGWSLAEDHIHFTIGRQAASLKQTSEAVTVFEKLLRASSKQPAPQQAAFLREFLHIHNVLREEAKTPESSLPIMPLPSIEDNQIKVLLGPSIKHGDNNELVNQILAFNQDADDVRWPKLEEILVAKAQGSSPMIFKPAISIFTNTSNNTAKPNAIMDEPIYVAVTMHNSLLIPLPLSNIMLLWTFVGADGQEISNETQTSGDDSPIDTSSIDAFTLQPTSKHTLVLLLRPRKVGSLKILGVAYDLSNSVQTPTDQPVVNPSAFVRGKRIFTVRGPKMMKMKEKDGVVPRAPDYRLDLNIVEKSPFLMVTFTKLSSEMLCGELQRMDLTLTNTGNAALKNIYLGSTNPKLFSLKDHPQTLTKNGKKNEQLITKIILPESNNERLDVGESVKLIFWICAPHEKGNHRLDFAFYYENAEPNSVPKYRMNRLFWHLTVMDSIQAYAVVRRSEVSRNDFSTMNLTIQIKNLNHVHDTFKNEIELTNVSMQSGNWTLKESAAVIRDVKVQPLESLHLLLKLWKKSENDSDFSDVLLSEIKKEENSIPYFDFVKKRHCLPLNISDGPSESQPSYKTAVDCENLEAVMKVDSTLIFRWTAKVTEGGVVMRNAHGQHYVDLVYLDKMYNLLNEKKPIPPECPVRLKIFGPDANVSDLRTASRLDAPSEAECLKSILWFSISHSRDITHDFSRNKNCVIPVSLLLQNNSEWPVDVKVDTIGSNTQTPLPNIRNELFTPQASNLFRFVGNTSMKLRLDPFGRHSTVLKAVVSASGTFDFATRIEISARLASRLDFVLQKWQVESLCFVNDEDE